MTSRQLIVALSVFGALALVASEVAAGVAQYPLYGWLLSRARSRGSLRRGVLFVAIVHGLAVVASLAALRQGAFAS